MANIAAITVYDGAGTPVAHTLNPVSVSRPAANEILCEWREVAATVPVYAQIRLSMRLTQLKSGVWKAEVTTVVPVMESVSGQNSAGYTASPKVAYETTFRTTMFGNSRSTYNDRMLARQLHINVLGNISTSVAAASTGFSPNLFDSLISAT